MTPMLLLDAAIHCTFWGTNGLIRRNGVILRWSGGGKAQKKGFVG